MNEKLKKDMDVVLPSDEIDCVDCRFKMLGKIGFKNRYCEEFPRDVGGKPDEVLFKGEKCPKKQTVV